MSLYVINVLHNIMLFDELVAKSILIHSCIKYLRQNIDKNNILENAIDIFINFLFHFHFDVSSMFFKTEKKSCLTNTDDFISKLET